MKQKRFLNHAMQEGIFLLLLGGWLLWYGLDAYSKSFNKDWTQSPSLFPVVVALLLAYFGVLIFAQGMREKNAAAEASKGGHALQVLALLGMSLLYYLALSVIRLPYMGVTVFSMTLTFSTFEAATIVFLLAMMLYLGVRSKRVLACVPVGATAFLSVMFRTLLRVLLP